MADLYQVGQDLCAFAITRGIEQTTSAITAPLTADERYWLETGVASGVLALLQTLNEAGWIKGPR